MIVLMNKEKSLLISNLCYNTDKILTTHKEAKWVNFLVFLDQKVSIQMLTWKHLQQIILMVQRTQNLWLRDKIIFLKK